MPQPPPVPNAETASTQTLAPEVPEGATRVFPCESCGADLTFSVGNQKLACPYCGFTKDLTLDENAEVREQDFAAALNRLAERRKEERPETDSDIKEVRCTSCGANLQFTGTIISNECAYCGIPLQLDNAHNADDRIPIDAVLPFTVSRESARDNLGKWVRSRWFAPSEFTKRGVQGRFNGVYLPYWTYDSLTSNRYSGQRGEHYWVTVGSGKNRRRVRRTRWYPASGSFQRFFDDVLVVAAEGMPTNRLVDLEPWPLKNCVIFNKQMLAGFLARTYDIPLDEAFTLAKERMAAHIEHEVRGRIGGDEQRIHSIKTRHEGVTYKHVLLPIWMLAYRFGQKSYQVVVNACTGEVQGDRPYSWIKISLAAVAGIAAAAVIGFLCAQNA